MTEKFPEPYSGEPLATHRVVAKDPSAKLRQYPASFTPGREDLAAGEIRVTALGTGYPARRAQGCAGFLAELGNGEVFIFDAGAGTNLAFNTLGVPYWKATRFFITHYHLDHTADLPVYYDFGQSNGRLEPDAECRRADACGRFLRSAGLRRCQPHPCGRSAVAGRRRWIAPGILEALIPGRMQSHACTAEVP